MTTNQKKHLLKEMYPYDIANKRNAALRKGLKEYAFFLHTLNEASRHFLNGDLERFDALVSENACQIRAIKIAIIASKKTNDFQRIIKEVTAAEKRLAVVLEDSKLAHLMITNVSLEEVLENENLDIVLTHEELFLFQAFILSEMKEIAAPGDFLPEFVLKDKSSPKKLKKLGSEISSTFALFLVTKLRKIVAETSINFVRKSAEKLQDPYLTKMTSQDYTIQHNDMPCLPIFWSYQALLKTAKNESIPFVAHIQFVKDLDVGFKIVDEEFLFFKCITDELGTRYELVSQSTVGHSTPACIFQGIVHIDPSSFNKDEWKARMSKHCILDVILAVAADHKQYPTENLGVPVSDTNYENYKMAAVNGGFSMCNPKTFFINHVFSMQSGKVFGLSKIA